MSRKDGQGLESKTINNKGCLKFIFHSSKFRKLRRIKISALLYVLLTTTTKTTTTTTTTTTANNNNNNDNNNNNNEMQQLHNVREIFFKSSRQAAVLLARTIKLLGVSLP